MATQQLLINLPEELYAQLRDRARASAQSVEDVARDVLASALPQEFPLPDELEAVVAPLALLDDDALWQAARIVMLADDATELDALHLQQQRAPLGAAALAREAILLNHYERVMLVRAEAARLLHLRGHDVSSLRAT